MLESKTALVAILLCLLLGSAPAAAQFAHDSDVAVRIDDPSDRPSRNQYRLRIRPSFAFDSRWSLHSFISTGDQYGSAYNTMSANDDRIHVRRLFLRYEQGDSKVELGVIPPYKGRVSSTGLSKEGWVRGARGVIGLPSGRLEFVTGALRELDASQALSSRFELDYFEIEYSAQINDRWSYELGAEKMFRNRFLRGEVRFESERYATWAAELVHNASVGRSKFVLSARKDFERRAGALEWFTYYAYAAPGFGQRAELSEDFLEFGHAIATSLKGGVGGFDRLEWFAEVELYEDLSRIKLGLEFSLN